MSIRKGHPVLSSVMSLVMSRQIVSRQSKDKFRVIWDRSASTHHSAHRYIYTFLSVAFSFSLTHTHKHTQSSCADTTVCTHSKYTLYTNPQYSIYLSQIMSSNLWLHADGQSRDTGSKAWIRHTHIHPRVNS